MPRTKRKYKEDEPPPAPDSSSGEEETSYTPPARYGGKQLRPGGKQIRLNEEPSDSSSSEEEEPVSYSRPGGGKQLRPGGKQIHYDESESEEEEEPAPIVYPQRGGKSLYGMKGMGKQLRQPQPESSDEESDDDEEEEEVMPVRRGGGKSLAVMSPRGGGKSLNNVMRRGGGKQLVRPPVDEEDESSDESDEEDFQPAAPAPAAAEDMDIEDSEEEEEVVKPPPKRPTRAAAASAAKKTEESDEDMDVSSSEEEESDSESEAELDMETMDQDRLIKDEEDRKYLESLPEIERESILADRFEELKRKHDMKIALRENKQREREAKRAARGKKGKSTKKKTAKKFTKKTAAKKKTDNVPDTSKDEEMAKELSLGRSAKNRDASGLKAKKKAALDKLRKEKAKKDEKEDSDIDYGNESESDSDSDASFQAPWQKKEVKPSKRFSKRRAAEYESDEDMDEPVQQKQDVEATLEDFQKVTIPRRRLARWCNEPYFERAVLNYYVRLAIGRDRKTMKPCYRLCKIVEIKTGQQYQFPPNEQNKVISTNKWLSLKFGENEKPFKMLMISDSKPIEEDVTMCIAQSKNKRGGAARVLTKKEAKKMFKKQNELVNNYIITEEDVAKSIAANKMLNKNIANIGAEKTKAAIALKAAETLLQDAQAEAREIESKLLEADRDDEEKFEEELEKAKEKVKELEQEVAIAKEAQDKILEAEKVRQQRLGRSAKNINWAKVNKKAKDMNKAADVEAYKSELAARREGTNTGTKDLYARRKVKPQILWEVGQKTEGKDAEKENAEKEAAPKEVIKAPVPEKPKEVKQKKLLTEQMNDLAMEDEALTVGLSLGTSKKVNRNRVRKGISIQEYLARKSDGRL